MLRQKPAMTKRGQIETDDAKRPEKS